MAATSGPPESRSVISKDLSHGGMALIRQWMLAVVVLVVGLGFNTVAEAGSKSKISKDGKVPAGYSIVGETDISPEEYGLAGVLDLGTDQWRTDIGGITARGYLSGAAVSNRFMYTIGGSAGSTILGPADENVLRYDSFLTTWTVVAPLLTPRNNLTAEAVNGKVYAIGGSSTAAGSSLATVEAFDPATGGWTPRMPIPTSRFALASTVLDGQIYAIGGVIGSSTGTGAVERYNPATDNWIPVAPLPTPRWNLAAAAVNGKIYAIGGTVTAGAQDARVEEYNPTNDSWTLKSPMPTARRGMRAAVVQGRIYLIGGFREGDGVVNTVEVYDPATNTWASRPPMPTARQFPAIAVLGNSIFVVGGSLGAGDTGVTETFEPRLRYYLHKKE